MKSAPKAAAPKKYRKKPGPKARAKARAEREVRAAANTPPGEPTPRPPSETPSAPPAELAALGAPPDDALAAQAWAHRAVILTMYDAARDTQLPPRERRKELRVLAASAAKLMPNARRWEAEQLIKSDRADLEQRESTKHGARLEPRPARQVPDASGA